MMTPYGSQFLKDFIKEIKRFDPIIVSGLAYGIDICAHQEALRNGICTVGVLAHGLDRIYPKSHAGIARKMLENGLWNMGASFISPYLVVNQFTHYESQIQLRCYRDRSGTCRIHRGIPAGVKRVQGPDSRQKHLP